MRARGTLWAVVVALLFPVIVSGQAIQAVHFAATVSSAPIFISPGEVQLEGLQSGTTYISIPDGTGGIVLTPNDGQASVSTATASVIAGDINSTVLVSFILPDRLYPMNGTGSGFVRMRFTENSAAWGANGAENNYFDPKLPVQMVLDGTGTAHLSLGGIFDVPPNTGADTYIGEALLIAQYVGL
jgi:hypothetical protein